MGDQQIVENSGPETEITDLHTDGELVFGVAWAFYANGAGVDTNANFEGFFGAHVLTGELEWIDGCRGDNYSIADQGDVLYTAGHTHECGMVDWKPETNPRTWQFANAMDKRGTPGKTNAVGSYTDWQQFDGLPATQMLHWLPLVLDRHLHGEQPGGLERRGERPVRRLRRRVPTGERHQPAGSGAVRGQGDRAEQRRHRGLPRADPGRHAGG